MQLPGKRIQAILSAGYQPDFINVIGLWVFIYGFGVSGSKSAGSTGNNGDLPGV